MFFQFFIAYFPQLSPSPMSTLSCHLLVPAACWGAFSGHAASSKQDGGCGPKYIHGCLGRSCLCSSCTSTLTQGLRRRRLETCRNDTVALAHRIANNKKSCSMCRIVLQKSFTVLQGLANFFRAAATQGIALMECEQRPHGVDAPNRAHTKNPRLFISILKWQSCSFVLIFFSFHSKDSLETSWGTPWVLNASCCDLSGQWHLVRE